MEMSLSLLRAGFLLVSSISHSLVLLLSGFFSVALRSLPFQDGLSFQNSQRLTNLLPNSTSQTPARLWCFPWQVNLKGEKLPLSAMIPDALRSKGWENGRMQNRIKIDFCLFCDPLHLSLSLIFFCYLACLFLLLRLHFSVLVIFILSCLLLTVSGSVLLFLSPFLLSTGWVLLWFSLCLRRVEMIFSGTGVSYCFSLSHLFSLLFHSSLFCCLCLFLFYP